MSRLFYFFLILGGGPILATGCSTPLHKAVKSIKPGLEKDQVLAIAGDPVRSDYVQGLEEWAYRYYIDGERQGTLVYFKHGQVVGTKATDFKPPLNVQLKDASSLWEYKQIVQLQKKKNKFPPKSKD